ncbi:dephospho-CoA kinase domain-containing protein isoform X2 [Thrips palmi]|uniref:Dephospho-CoA kinase domain-containing protein isoform X2 n=1 Tax=Thrips palmi TaxID=161013 RepID=A0A6P9AJF1_THRPL|nr:dephospho-CoA kinase domain-containing protein isoform X2 [Thrips palmi]
MKQQGPGHGLRPHRLGRRRNHALPQPPLSVVEPGTTAWKKIKEEFGEEILLPSGKLNREKLGEIIFGDIDKRRKLNEWTHPEIHRTIMFEVLRYFLAGHRYVVLDLPLLFESGVMLSYIYKIICVTCTPEQQLERLIKRNSMSKHLAEQRIAAQMPLEVKCEKAHYIIDNTSDIENTRVQAKRVIGILNDSWEHWRIRLYIGVLAAVVFLPILYWWYYV